VKRPLEPHYTGRHLAELLAVNPETIRRAAARGELKSVRVGLHRRYPESAVQDWLSGRAGGEEES
jgi:excisionase family DNA binding protein